jgi:hypothetical protein
MNSAFNACFKTSTQLINSTCLFGFGTCRKKHNFGEELSPSLTYPNKLYPWALVECHEATCHERSVGSPWREGVGHSLNKHSRCLTKVSAGCSKSEQPMFESVGVLTSQSRVLIKMTAFDSVRQRTHSDVINVKCHQPITQHAIKRNIK